MSETNESIDIAQAILGGAAAQLIHGTLCSEARLTLQVGRLDKAKRRLQCVNCEQFVQLPVGEDYDLCWIQIGQQPLLEKIASMPSPGELTRNSGVCFHGIPMGRECPQCAAEAAGMKFVPGGPQALTGQIRPPEIKG